MAQACPLNFISVDNTLGRIGSLLTAVAVGIFLVTDSPVWLYLLGTDLLIRLYGNRQYSPIFQSARMFKRFFRLPTQTVDGAAKNVAGHFGLLFILMMIAAAHLGLHATLDIIAAVYVLCLLMDTFFNFCVGCKVYYVYRLIAGAV